MIRADYKEANENIAKFIGFTKSELGENYWNCGEWGLSFLKFHESWEWLIFAVQKVQVNHLYMFTSRPINLEYEVLELGRMCKTLNELQNK